MLRGKEEMMETLVGKEEERGRRRRKGRGGKNTRKTCSFKIEKKFFLDFTEEENVLSLKGWEKKDGQGVGGVPDPETR